MLINFSNFKIRFVAVGIAFLVLGNSVMGTITQGMESSFKHNFTGDLILRTTNEEDIAFIGGFGGVPKPLEDYTNLVTYLQTMEGITKFTPILSSAAGISKDDRSLSFALLWGIEPSSYFEMFPDRFILTAGSFLKDGQEGVLLSQTIIDGVSTQFVCETASSTYKQINLSLIHI